MNERESTVILSDIHIGTTSSTIGYRKEIHEKYLIAVLNDIIRNADWIQEVILLGDIFEFWTYLPEEIPPTMQDIIVTHPTILDTKGKLCEVLNALKGRVVYIPGDHDMNVTQSELNQIKSTQGYTIKYHAAPYIPTYDMQIKFTHGHEYSALNAPCFASKLAPLPIGYFVTRAIEYKKQNHLKKFPDSVDKLDKYKENSLNQFLSKLPNLIKNNTNRLDVINRFIDEVVEATGIPYDLKFQVNRSIALSFKELKNVYFYEDFNRTFLPWYENNNIWGNEINIVVMGHTHSPSSTFNHNVHYINTGFMCPQNPNLSPHITYGIYNRSNRKVSLIKVMEDEPVNLQPYSKTNAKKFPFGRNIIIANSTPSNNFIFGFSNYDDSLEFFGAIKLGVLSKATELDIKVITQDQKSNTIDMITGSLDLISKSIDALIIVPYNPEELPVIVSNAKKLQIPVVAIDTGTGGAEVVAFIVSDSFGGGVYAGEYSLILIKKYSISSMNVALIKLQQTTTYAIPRGLGFKSVMMEKGYTVVAEEIANGVEAEGYEVMKNILASYANDLAVVFCENGTMALGAARAIDEEGKKGIIMLIGFDAGPSVIEAIKNGSIQGTIAQQPFKMGEIAVETANSVLLGIPVLYDDPPLKIILMEVYLVNEYGEIKREIR